MEIEADPVGPRAQASRGFVDLRQTANLDANWSTRLRQAHCESWAMATKNKAGQETPSLARAALNFVSGLTPTKRSTSLPPSKTSTVGMAEIRRLPGVSWFSSVFILPTLTRPSNSRASVSMVGASIRQGPHHGAQK